MAFLKKRIESFKYAIHGIVTFFRTQTHPKIHLTATIFVIIAGFYFNVSPTEWMILILTMTSVIMAEAFNSAIEFLSDKVSPDIDPIIKKVKDISAGAVLICAITSVFIGLIIFLPRIIQML